jgi:hypothetical protein
MSKQKKNYKLPSPVTELIGCPNELIVNKVSSTGELVKTFDFTHFKGSIQLRSEVALALRHYGQDKATITCVGAYLNLKQWLEYIHENEGHITCTRLVTSQSLKNFIAWLNNKPYKIGSRHNKWSYISQIFKSLKRNRPDLCNPDLVIPFNAFPRKNAETKPREGLSRTEIERVLAAARSDINMIMERYQRTQDLLKQKLPKRLSKKDKFTADELKQFRVLLHVIESKHDGFVPDQATLLKKGSGISHIYKAISNFGGTKKISSMLYPFAEDIIPFMIAIGAQTFANPEGLRCMKRDCMSEHLLLEGRSIVSWDKGRSKRPQQRSFLSAKQMSVPKLINQVLTLTERLSHYAPEAERNNIFLIHGLNNGYRAKLIPDYLTSVHVRRFTKRHQLVCDEGKPLNLTLVKLRTTGLTLSHEQFGYDILKTQAVANHYSPDTTMSYVDNVRVRDSHQKIIHNLQAYYIDEARAGVDAQNIKSLSSEPTELRVENATAAGFTCRDPLASNIPGQRKGVMCTAWLGCFTCPNAVIPISTDALVRLLSTKKALLDAKKTVDSQRWKSLYLPKLEIIEQDIIPKFPEKTLKEAMSKAFIALPDIE